MNRGYLNAKRLHDDAKASGNSVAWIEDEDSITVRIVDDIGDSFTASWWRTPSGGYRLGYSTDGWREDLSLRTIRSFVVDSKIAPS